MEKKKRGGYRPGSGRKTIHEELNVAQMARSALIKKFGSLEDAMIWTVGTKEPSLIKFVAEHAFGKPTEHIEATGEFDITNIVGMKIYK